VIIVAGHIEVRPGRREALIAASTAAMVAARQTRGCLDFVVAADPVEPDRVAVYERWATRPQLLAFRGDGPGPDLTPDIVAIDVTEYDVTPASDR
jgi:quinol monooxygenase YgiN